jgi:hypothetical protein
MKAAQLDRTAFVAGKCLQAARPKQAARGRPQLRVCAVAELERLAAAKPRVRTALPRRATCCSLTCVCRMLACLIQGLLQELIITKRVLWLADWLP